MSLTLQDMLEEGFLPIEAAEDIANGFGPRAEVLVFESTYGTEHPWDHPPVALVVMTHYRQGVARSNIVIGAEAVWNYQDIDHLHADFEDHALGRRATKTIKLPEYYD